MLVPRWLPKMIGPTGRIPKVDSPLWDEVPVLGWHQMFHGDHHLKTCLLLLGLLDFWAPAVAGGLLWVTLGVFCKVVFDCKKCSSHSQFLDGWWLLDWLTWNGLMAGVQVMRLIMPTWLKTHPFVCVHVHLCVVAVILTFWIPCQNLGLLQLTQWIAPDRWTFALTIPIIFMPCCVMMIAWHFSRHVGHGTSAFTQHAEIIFRWNHNCLDAHTSCSSKPQLTNCNGFKWKVTIEK